MLNHLVNIASLSKAEITEICNTAQAFKLNQKKSDVAGKTVALMFFENSTRTKISFELAARKLGMEALNFESKTSSINKGETLRDTLENLYFIGINSAIIRTTDDNLIENMIKEVRYPIKFFNAGSGKSSHPTQALLDYFTMREKLSSVEGKKVVIVGDIEHSRVAKSNIALLQKFGANITICAPDFFKPKSELGVNYSPDLKEAISNADVVMGLRIQKERIEEAYNEADYIKNYQISSAVIEKHAPNAIVMHPGPVNREVEITSELLDSKKGETILEQARNGVFVRMAVLNMILGVAK